MSIEDKLPVLQSHLLDPYLKSGSKDAIYLDNNIYEYLINTHTCMKKFLLKIRMRES